MEGSKDAESNVYEKDPREPLSVFSSDVKLQFSTSGSLTYPELTLGDIAVFGIETTIHEHVENDNPRSADRESIAKKYKGSILHISQVFPQPFYTFEYE